VIIESDCVRVVKAMKEKKDLSDLSFIFAEAFDHAQLLSSWRVVKVNRDLFLKESEGGEPPTGVH
jgi:hypothetical protein